MLNLKYIFIAVTLFTSFYAQATDPDFSFSDRRGFWITPDLPASNQLVLPENATTIIKGTICAVKISTTYGRTSCEKLKKGSIEVSSYFPDELSEVTAQTRITQAGNNFAFNYTTPALTATQSNTFTLLVGNIGDKTKKLNQLMAKLKRIISMLKDRREQIRHRRNGDKMLPWFDQLIANFERTLAGLDKLIELSPDVLARYTLPLQVKNNISGKQVMSSVFNGMRVAYLLEKGVHFDGEPVNATIKLTNLTNANFSFPSFDDDNDNDDRDPSGEEYKLEVKLGGRVVYQKNIIGPNAATEASYPFSFGKIDSRDDLDLEINLYRLVKWYRTTYPSKVAQLKTELLVADDLTTPQWKVAKYTDLINYVQNIETFNYSAADALGQINPDSFISTWVATNLAGVNSTTTSTANYTLTNIDQGREYQITYNQQNLPEGFYSITQKIKDYAGHEATPSPLNFMFQVDRTAPHLQLAQTDHTLTNQASFPLEMFITDRSAVKTKIYVNGEFLREISGATVSTTAPLVEGHNSISLVTTDAALNQTVLTLTDITLDSTPPVLAQIVPVSGATVFTLDFNLAGTSNEALSKVLINGEEVNLNGATQFTKALHAFVEGDFAVELTAIDLAGNRTTKNLTYGIFLKVLRADLIKLEPKNGKIAVVGMPGAAAPGALVEVSGGFLNSKDVVASADGSFEVLINFTDNINIHGVLDSVHREDTVRLTFNADTTLSGIVKDITNAPLPGVTVKILTSGQTATTNASGVFSIPKPITGDQEIVIDGTTIPETFTGSTVKFSKTHLRLSIGNLQQNVMARTIYLTPLLSDGSETIVTASAETVVTSPHAPGVELHIPAGVAIFPDGSKTGAINMMEISKEVTTIPVPDFAEPDTVFALEPSGLKFSEPIKLVLPNVNEFPAGMEVVIMSKNSADGLWKINGAAKVSDNGQSIITKDGLGITHFSEVFAAPYGLDVATPSSADVIGADTFNGSMSNAISIPGTKSLGSGLAPTLYYNSKWAYPNAVVKNIFDFPKKEMVTNENGSSDTVYGKVIADYNTTSWVVPEWIDAWFTIGGKTTSKARFNGVPERSTVSYAVDLSDLPSGVYPYQANYEIQFRQLAVRKRTLSLLSSDSLQFMLQLPEEITTYQKLLDNVFPQSIPGRSFVQNKINSNVGRGVKLGLTKKIVNPSSDFIMLEGNDGGIATYGLDHRVETLIFDADGMRGFDLKSWPNISYVKSTGNNILTWNDQSRQTTSKGSIQGYKGEFGVNYPMKLETWGQVNATMVRGPLRCIKRKYSFEKPRVPYTLLQVAQNDFFGVDELSSIFKITDGEFTKVVGSYGGTAPTFASWEGDQDYLTSCRQNMNTDCSSFPITSDVSFDIIGSIYPTNSVYIPIQEIMCDSTQTLSPSGLSMVRDQCLRGNCDFRVVPSSGEYDRAGFSEGNLSTSLLNNPKGIIPGVNSNTLLLADTGNNRIRLIDLTNNTISTFAGNGQTYDNGDGGMAIDASIYHPTGLARDSHGNVYVSTERGYIRRIDSSGRISAIAGKDLTSGGSIELVTTIDKVNFSSPAGMAIDESSNSIYVADTGHNRIVKLDLTRGEARQVAGNNTCNGTLGDNGPALEATFCRPEHIGLDDNKNLLVGDPQFKRVRRVNFNKTTNGSLTYAPIKNDGSFLKKETDGTFTLTFRNGAKDYFDSTGKQTSSWDRAGRIVQYQYDDEKLTRVTDPVGRTTQLDYGFNGKLSQITDPVGRVTEFSYNGDTLSEVTFPDGSARKFSYNQKGMMTSETNQRGVITQYLYNQWDRLTQVVTDGQNQASINDADSKTIANNYTPASGQRANFANNAQNYDGIKDPKNVETKFNKDMTGFVATITDGDGKITTIERDSEGKPVTITRPDGSYSNFTYNPTTKDLISKFNSLSNSTQNYSYDQYGNLLSYTNAKGYTSTNTYDDTTGLPLTSRDALGNVSSKTYRTLGLVSSQSNALGQSSTYEYDNFGNLIKTTSNGGKITTFTRDAAGNIIATTNPKGQITRYEYDVMNRLKSVTTPRGLKTSYDYLATGELSVITDPVGNMTKFEYDNLGRLIKKTDALGYVSTLSYDVNSNLIRETDPNGNVKTYEYDNLNRMTKKHLPDNLYQLSYDVRGNISQISDNDSSLIYSYTHFDDNDLVTSLQISGTNTIEATLSFDYDQNGNRTRRIDPTGTTNYSYDQLDRLTSLTTPNGRRFDYTYDVISRMTKIAGGVVDTSFAFDADNALSSMVSKNNSNVTISSLTFIRDQINNITRKTSSSGVSDFGYDEDSELISATNPDVSDSFNAEEFIYDELSNRIHDQIGSQTLDQKKQRLGEDYRYLYVYDMNGNLTSQQDKTATGTLKNYTYNSENQLIQVNIFENNLEIKKVQYFYDALGRRSSKVITDLNDNTKSYARKYLYDADEIIAEYDGSGNILAKFTQSGLRTDDTLSFIVTTDGQSQGLAPNTGEYFYIKDQLGSITQIVDQSGTIVQRYTYSAFGKILKITDQAGMNTTQNPDFKMSYTFTNREYDQETGLYYYRARYYDANTGRFNQQDPDPGKLMEPITFNSKYVYASSNPVFYTDPTGQFRLKFRTALATFAFAPSIFVRPFLGSELDQDRFSNLVIAASIITVAAVLSPGAAAAAAGSTIIGNVGRDNQGNFFDALPNYTAQFALNYGLQELQGGAEFDKISLLKGYAIDIGLRVGFDAIERNYGAGTLNTVKVSLFFAFPGRNIHKNFKGGKPSIPAYNNATGNNPQLW